MSNDRKIYNLPLVHVPSWCLHKCRDKITTLYKWLNIHVHVYWYSAKLSITVHMSCWLPQIGWQFTVCFWSLVNIHFLYLPGLFEDPLLQNRMLLHIYTCSFISLRLILFYLDFSVLEASQKRTESRENFLQIFIKNTVVLLK